MSREAKLSLLSCISTSGDPQLLELGLQLHLGDSYLQTQDSGYSIISKACSQLLSLVVQMLAYNDKNCLKTRFYANHFFNPKDKILRQAFHLVFNDKLLHHCHQHKLDCDSCITSMPTIKGRFYAKQSYVYVL